MRVRNLICLSGLLLTTFFIGNAQEVDDPGNINGRITSLNMLKYSVSFLTIAPDTRGGALGDAGVATSPDVYSMHWNPSKLAFIESDMGVGVSYTPWLRKLVDDMYLVNLAFYKRLDDRQVVSTSLKYFSLGEIVFRSDNSQITGEHKPNEFSIDAAYSRKFSEVLSGSVAFRYIRSDLTGGAFSQTEGETHAGNSFAADVSFFYTKPIKVSEKDARLNFGLNISNIGSKMTYTTDEDKQFIPTNLRLGSALTVDIDEYNSFMFTTDINKLLVPTPPLKDDNQDIIAGKDDEVSPIVGVFQSFWDAPGGTDENRLKEELHEIMYSVGAEYWYNKQMAVRAGYFHEHEDKGNRKYFTAGIGIKLNVFAFDAAYLIPKEQNHPVANTLRFSLSFDIGAFKENQNKGR